MAHTFQSQKQKQQTFHQPLIANQNQTQNKQY